MHSVVDRRITQNQDRHSMTMIQGSIVPKKIFHKALLILILIAIFVSACGDSEASDLTNSDQYAALVGDPANGEVIFQSTCSACHGPDAKGLPNLGKDLTTSEFVAGESDTNLIAFVIAGRDIDDSENTAGIAMPPRGGNVELSDQDIADVVAHVRTLQE